MLRRSLLVVTLTLLSAAPAAAQESDDELARNHFLAGRSYFAQSRFEDAMREFEEAYRLSPRPELLRNISVAAERAGDLPRAIEAAEQYLQDATDPPDRRTQEQRLETLRAQQTDSPPPPDDVDDGGGDPGAGGGGAPAADGGGPSPLMIAGIASLGVALASVAIFATTGGLADVNYARLEEECSPSSCPPDLEAVRDEGSTLATVSTAFTFVAIGTAILGGVLILVDVLGGSSDEQAVGLGPSGEMEVRF